MDFVEFRQFTTFSHSFNHQSINKNMYMASNVASKSESVSTKSFHEEHL